MKILLTGGGSGGHFYPLIAVAQSINEIANLALKAANSEHLRIAYDKSKPNGQYRKDISTEKLQKLFPDFKFTSYLEGIKKTYKTITNE